MKTNKITPQVRELIISRVNSGELQKDIAIEFDLSKGRVSQIVNASKEQPSRSETSLESVPIANLLTQLTELTRQIDKVYSEKAHRRRTVENLQVQIESGNKALLETDDAELKQITEDSMTATQRMITWNTDHKTLDAQLMDLYAEQLAIFRELFRRGHSFPARPRY